MSHLSHILSVKEDLDRSKLTKQVLNTIHFFVEGSENRDKKFYDKQIREVFHPYYMGIRMENLPIEVTACGSYEKVIEKVDKNKSNNSYFYIIDSDFNKLHYKLRGEFLFIDNAYKDFDKLIMTEGYAIENYANSIEFARIIGRELNDPNESNQFYNDLNQFIEKIIPLTILKYILVTKHSFHFKEDNPKRDRPFNNQFEKEDPDITYIINSINENRTTNKINIDPIVAEVGELRNSNNISWKKYTRGKSILWFIRQKYQKAIPAAEKDFIQYLKDIPCPVCLKSKLELLVNRYILQDL